MKSQVLILGSGGREHALAQHLAQDENISEIFIAPGNEGIEFSHHFEVKIKTTGHQAKIVSRPELKTIDSFLEFSIKNNIALTIVGNEEYLSLGVVDLFASHQIPILGPTQLASQIESSKLFSKNLMMKMNIPTALFQTLYDQNEANHFLRQYDFRSPIVIKASPLAQGKGVFICSNREEGQNALKFLNSKNLYPLILEEYLKGRELSHFTLCDGLDYKILGHACDYKRLLDHNQGPNTGGMGSYSPADWISEREEKQIEEWVVRPILQAMFDQGTPYQGILFTGIMVTDQGIKVLEFNARLGDPETQSLIPRLDESLFPWFMAVALHQLSSMPKRGLKFKQGSSVHVVLANKNYPFEKSPAVPINLSSLFQTDLVGLKSSLTFSGVKIDKDPLNKKIIADGGRVLGITSIGNDREEARVKAYQLINKIPLGELQLRGDIGL